MARVLLLSAAPGDDRYYNRGAFVRLKESAQSEIFQNHGLTNDPPAANLSFVRRIQGADPYFELGSLASVRKKISREANKSVNSTDVSETKLQSGTAVTAANFRTDVTLNGVGEQFGCINCESAVRNSVAIISSSRCGSRQDSLGEIVAYSDRRSKGEPQAVGDSGHNYADPRHL